MNVENNQYKTVYLGNKSNVKPKSPQFQRTYEQKKNNNLDASTEPTTVPKFEREFVQKFIEYRTQKVNKNQREIAQMLNIPQTTISKFESYQCDYDPNLKNRINRWMLNIDKQSDKVTK